MSSATTKDKQYVGFVLNKEDDPQAYKLGAVELPKIVLRPDGQWDDFLPSEERQHFHDYETYGCTIFGTENVQQILEKFHFGLSNEYDERYHYNLVGINPPGADPHDAAESFRRYGAVSGLLPIPDTYEEYAAPRPVPKKYVHQGKKHPHELKHQYLWRRTNLTEAERTAIIREHLPHGPLGVSVTGWYERDGVYVDNGAPNTHWTVIYGEEKGKGWKVFDTYEPHKKILSYSHNIEVCKRYALVPSTRSFSFWEKIQDIFSQIFTPKTNLAGAFPVTLRRKVIVSSQAYPQLAKHLKGAKKVIEHAKNLRVEYDISDDDVGIPETYEDKKGKLRINRHWFQGEITNQAVAEGYDGAVFIFTLDDSERWGNLGSGLRGTTLKDGDHFDEMWIRSDDETKDRDGFRVVRTLAHEEGHAIKHRGITNLEVHDYDEDIAGDLEHFFSLVDATYYAINRRKTTQFALVDTLTRVTSLIVKLILMKKGMTHPIPKEWRQYVSQGFLVPNPIYQSGVHNGTDWAIPEGTPIYAPADGMIDRVFKKHPELGNACHFIFKDPNGVQRGMRLLHLKKAPLHGFYEQGEVLGYSGNTGKVRGKNGGYHVCVGLWKNGLRTGEVSTINTKQGVQENMLDPQEFFLTAK